MSGGWVAWASERRGGVDKGEGKVGPSRKAAGVEGWGRRGGGGGGMVDDGRGGGEVRGGGLGLGKK